jgi:hypothetical protein
MAVSKLRILAIVVLTLVVAAGVSLVVERRQAERAWPESRVRFEIRWLAQAVGAFKQEFNVTWLPSRILLREDGAYNLNNQVEKDTVVFFQQMFGKRLNLAGIDWNGDGVISNEPVTLGGDQCLVFFLGGIPAPGTPEAVLGFSTDPTNPAAGTRTRRGPFLEFDPRRLVEGNAGFFRYLDAFNKGSPYAYFSSYNTTNGYNRYGSSDCEALGVSPYQESEEVFINPKGFQILSAGRDAVFGAGGTSWEPTRGYPAGDPGADHLSNFSASRLGSPQS